VVIDYIGNHRTFLIKPQTLFGLGSRDIEITRALTQNEEGTAQLPPGCEVRYELKAVEIIKGLLRSEGRGNLLRLYYQDFRDRHGVRPRVAEVYQEGYAPRRLGLSWHRFVRDMGDLSGDEGETVAQCGEFLASLQVTPMTRSFKMLVLLAMLNADAFPGEIHIVELVRRVRELALRSAKLREDLGTHLDHPDQLRKLIEENPIKAWTGAKGTNGVAYFGYDGETFRTTEELDRGGSSALQDLTRELVDWRLAEYLDRH
jgi:hypothetical protein